VGMTEKIGGNDKKRVGMTEESRNDPSETRFHGAGRKSAGTRESMEITGDREGK